MSLSMKEQMQKAVKLVQNGQYKDAISFIDILLMKDQKNIDLNMLQALAYQKLQMYDQSESTFIYCYNKKPDDPKILNSLFKLYKDDMKQLQKAIEFGQKLIISQKKIDKKKGVDCQIELCKLLYQDQQRQELDNHFLEVCRDGTAEQVLQFAEFYIPLIMSLKLVKLDQPEANEQILRFSQKLKNQIIQYKVLEDIIRNKVISALKSELQDKLSGFACDQQYFHLILKWLKLFPQSCFLLDEILKYVHCFLQNDTKFILEQSLLLLLHNEYSDLGLHNDINLYQNYTEVDQYQITASRAKVYICFIRTFASDFLLKQGQQFYESIDIIIRSKQIDFIEKEKNFSFLEIPLKVQELYKSGQPENQQKANQLLVDFNQQMKLLRVEGYECGILEEVSANLGYEVLADPIELMEMKNLLKVRIKNQAFSTETYEKYFDYQIKLNQMIRHYDEELPMQLIFAKILSDNPNNAKIQIQSAWLKFSEGSINEETLVEEYKAIKCNNFKEEILIYKRLGTLLLMKNNIDSAYEYFSKASQLCNDDHEIYLSIGIVEYLKNNLIQALEYFYRAFNICQTNFHLNQIIMYMLNKLGLKDKALEFAINIYRLPQFQNIYWLAFTIGQHLMFRAQFNRAHEMLQKAADLYHFNIEKGYKLYYEKKLDFGQFSIPYFINQNENYFLSDYPIFSADFFVNNNMILLTDKYFQQDRYLKLFKLEMKLAELKKILGLQGSALKSIEKAEQLLIQENVQNTINQLDVYLDNDHQYDGLIGTLIEFVKKFNLIQIQSKWINTLSIRKLDLSYCKLLILLNFEAAQLQLYGQNEYFSQERAIIAILMTIHTLINDPNDNEVLNLIKCYIPFVFEIGIQQIKQQKDYFSTNCSTQLCQKYFELFTIIQPYLSNNTYTNECMREFYYYLGLLVDKQYFQQSINYNKQIIFQLCQLDSDIDVNEMFQQCRSLLYGQEKKMLIVKNSLHSILLCLKHTQQEYKKWLTLAISLFPKSDTFYLIGAILNQDKEISYLVKALECNPKSQAALLQLGVYYMKFENHSLAFQTFQKCIECEPTTSELAYLGIALICLIYLQNNNNLQLTEINKLRQLEALSIHQLQLHNQIHSYLNYVSTLKSVPLQNILSVIYRNVFMGDTIKSDSLIYELKLDNIPLEFREILTQELAIIKGEYQVDKFKELVTYEGLKAELNEIFVKMNQYEEHKNQYKWSQQLRYLLHITCLLIDKTPNQEALDQLIDQVFNFLIKNLIQIKQAIYVYNFDDIYIQLIDRWYHYTRTSYLHDDKYQNQYFAVVQFKQSCYTIEQEGTQYICYVDVFYGANRQKLSNELMYKTRFMQHLHKNECKEAIKQLKLAILNNPKNYTYRSVLEKINNQVNTQIKNLILNMNDTNQSLYWYQAILNETMNLRKYYGQFKQRIDLICRIIKFKILPYSDKYLNKQITKLLCDCLSYDQNNQNVMNILKDINVDYQKYLKQSEIQFQLFNQNYQSAQQMIQQYKEQYIDQFEDYQNSKKTAQFLLPILAQLSFQRPNRVRIHDLLNQALQYTLYAQQFIGQDAKLKQLRFIYNTLLYTHNVRQINNIDTIAVTLTNLKEISEEFLSQGISNQQSISLFMHYAIATDKYKELSEWLDISQNYLNYNDLLYKWAVIMSASNMVSEQKNIESLKALYRTIEKQEIKEPSLQSLCSFIVGSAMMNVKDWTLKFSKEEVLKKYQIASLLNPSSQIAKHLSPLQTVRKRKIKNTRLKYDSLLRDDVNADLQNKGKKKHRLGLNSDSDDDIIENMDFHADLEDFKKDHGIGTEEQLQEYQQQYQEQMQQIEQMEYMEQMQQQVDQIEFPIEFYEMSNEDKYYYLQQQGYEHEQIIHLLQIVIQQQQQQLQQQQQQY